MPIFIIVMRIEWDKAYREQNKVSSTVQVLSKRNGTGYLFRKVMNSFFKKQERQWTLLGQNMEGFLNARVSKWKSTRGHYREKWSMRLSHFCEFLYGWFRLLPPVYLPLFLPCFPLLLSSFVPSLHLFFLFFLPFIHF